MKAAWVRPGGPLFPDQAKAKRIGLEQFFWDANDPQLDKSLNGGVDVLGEMRKAGWKVGTTRDPGWTNTADPKAFAALLSADIDRLAGPGVQHSTIADMEMHDPAYVLKILMEFRRLRPGRYLYWTLEPLQGGWFTPDLADWLNKDSMTWVVPQCYRWNMAPVSELAVFEDVVGNPGAITSILPSKVLSYYGDYVEAFNGVIFDWAKVAA